MQATIQGAKQTWQSPDGQRKLYEVTLTDSFGKLQTRKTWSGKIGTGMGQQFDLEEYTKDGNRGPETFVRQVQDPNSQYARPTTTPSPASSPGQPKSAYADTQADTRASIERQTGLKASVEVVANYYNAVGIQPEEDITLEQYVADVVKYSKVLGEAASNVPSGVADAFPGATTVDEPFASTPQQTQGSLV